MTGMRRPTKLGIAAILLLGVFIVSPFMIGNLPFGWIFAVFAALFGWMASRQGNKWWSAIPISILIFVAFVVLMVFHKE
ncbi:hypothetical protein [Tunturiibacter gelidoferens]|uniref:Putative membrane metal-binding protein n=1 Tax=Tunturiibacter lichenicola TaxID=2051959 RepID=A0A7Y9T2B1_9BACT|nr:hypothetical protein [Edaphobacter lichenicola]NYF50967.1 putative membrane metal-binding protein [Edaphobacter lichenicola]